MRGRIDRYSQAKKGRAIPNPKKDRDVRLKRKCVKKKRKKGWTGMDQVK